MNITADVVIIGAGPAGASLACFLSSHGIRGIIADMNSTSADTPRAHITNMAALECLRDIGLDTVLANLATKDDCMLHTRWGYSMAGREYARIHSWGSDPKRKGDYESASPCTHCDLPQTLLEPELVRYATLHGFQLRWDTEYVSFEQDSHGVTVRLLDNLTRQSYSIRAKYLFGADGARSRIVEQLKLPLQTSPGGGPAFNILVKADLSHLIKHRMGNLHWVIQPDREPCDFGWISIVRMVKPWHEWMFIMLPTPGYTLDKRPTQEQYLQRVREMIGDDTPAEIIRANVWNINEIVAETYSKDRVFCLGDAVHRHPPFNGLGSNTCIQDAFNLAWKVSYVIQNKAREELLETYSLERQPVGKSVVQRANDGFRAHAHVWSAMGITLPTVEERKAVLEELASNTPAGQARRADFQEAISETCHEFHGLGIEMNQSYHSSAVIEDVEEYADHDESNPDPILYHIRSTRPGRRLPHVWLNRPVPCGLISTIDVAGKGGFAIFSGIGGEAWKTAAASVSEAMDVPIQTHFIGFGQEYEDAYFDWARLRAVKESGCVLVRPDRFVAWRCREMQGDSSWAKETLTRVMRSILSR